MTPTDPALNAHKSILTAMAAEQFNALAALLGGTMRFSAFSTETQETYERAMAAALRVAAERIHADKQYRGQTVRKHAVLILTALSEQAND